MIIFRAVLAVATPMGAAYDVLEMRELHAPTLHDPHAHLVIRMHYGPPDVKLTPSETIAVCYSMDFNYYGIIGEPESITCPENALPITTAGVPLVEDSGDLRRPGALGAGRSSRRSRQRESDQRAPAGGAASRTGRSGDGEAGSWGRPGCWSRAGCGRVLPRQRRRCLLGSRVAGATRVWRPQGHPCTPAAAVAKLGAP